MFEDIIGNDSRKPQHGRDWSRPADRGWSHSGGLVEAGPVKAVGAGGAAPGRDRGRPGESAGLGGAPGGAGSAEAGAGGETAPAPVRVPVEADGDDLWDIGFITISYKFLPRKKIGYFCLNYEVVIRLRRKWEWRLCWARRCIFHEWPSWIFHGALALHQLPTHQTPMLIKHEKIS